MVLVDVVSTAFIRPRTGAIGGKVGNRSEVLLTRYTSGEWHIHGGKVKHNETPTMAAARESREEHGIDASQLDFVSSFASGEHMMHLFAARAPEPLEVKILEPSKHCAVKWVTIDDMANCLPALPSLLMSQERIVEYLTDAERVSAAAHFEAELLAQDEKELALADFNDRTSD